MTISEIRRGTAAANGIEIAYEDLGDADAPPVLLIMGFSAQLTLWPEGFVGGLVDRGYRVIRFDNRDIGLSTKFDGQRVEGSPVVRMWRGQFGLASRVPYTLRDMARDAEGLLDHLGIESAHVVGASMGGMIAQILAASSPQRVRSLGIFFSTTSQPLLPPPRAAAMRVLLKRPTGSAEEIIAASVRARRTIGSPKYARPLADLEADVRRDFERSYYPAGVLRQLAAATGTGSLLPYSRRITAPTVVIHGASDPLLRPRCGRAVTKAIRGAKLHMYDGMGHDLPQALWPRFTEVLTENFAR